MMIYATLLLIAAIIGMTMLLHLTPLRLEPKGRSLYFIVMLLVVAISIVFMLEIGRPFIALYPLLIHLPLVIIFCALSHRGLAKVLFVLLTMIFLSYPPTLVYWLAEKYLHVSPAVELVLFALASALVLLCIRKYMQQDFHYIMEHLTTRETLRFCFVPIGYNIIVYTLGRYDYSTTDQPVRILLFLSALGVYSLLLGFFRHTREMEQIQRERDVLDLQMQAAGKQILTLQASSEQARLYRHDMRHQLALLGSFLSDGDIQGATDYLKQAQEDIDAITPIRYCENNTLNLILTHFVDRAGKLGVALSPQVQLPQGLSRSETELCALLSNGLENAISAAAQLEDPARRTVRLTIGENRGNLLILVENAYSGDVQIKNGIPFSAREGHGFGCRSMVAMAEKQGGICSFQADNGTFTLRMALPLAREAASPVL